MTTRERAFVCVFLILFACVCGVSAAFFPAAGKDLMFLSGAALAGGICNLP